MNKPEDLDIETLLEALEVLSDGVAIYGPDRKPLYSNASTLCRFRRISEDMQAGMAYHEAVREQVRRAMPGASDAAIDTVAGQYVAKFENNDSYITTSDDGRDVVVTFREMSQGRRAAISVDVTDLTRREKELKKARKAAEAASASKSAFLANMSHEIRTPLNGIMGMAQVLDATNLDQQQRDYVATILDSGKSLMALLNDVLDLSKIEAGKFDIVPTDTNLAHVMRRQLKLWKPRAEEKGLELTLAFDADLPAWLCFDAVRVQQCVSNLVSNAIKFTAKGRVEVMVAARPEKDGTHQIRVSVRDTGAGMDEETLGRLFQPFAQADETTQRKHGGTGLGLSITRRLAELMGGTASVQSEPGRGSTFTVTFRGGPARVRMDAPAQQAASDGDLRSALRSSNLRVLLVDDHPINRQVASLFLKPFNMRIVEATNGAEALAALEREAFDLVLLDMHMPVMDGPATIEAIRSSDDAWRTIPVIALTADAMSGDRERYLAMGMDGYLSKPLAERELLSEIARVRSGGREEAPLSKAG